MKLTVKYLDSDQNYPIVFDINVLDEIQSNFGDMEKWHEALAQSDFSAYKKTITICVNEAFYYLGIDKKIDERRAGLILSEEGMIHCFQHFNDLATEFMNSFGGDNGSKNA